jgi:hypothetical protein
VRRFVGPGWLAWHLLAVGLVLVFLRLGLWQWHRASSNTGGVQNIGYAFEWPLFAGFVVFMWVKIIRDEVRRPAHSEPANTRTSMATGIDEYDEELAAYNRYFARLYEKDPEHSSGGGG